MGQCCKCGREARAAYTYVTADVEVYEAWQGAVSYHNVERHDAFLCVRCALLPSLAIYAVCTAVLVAGTLFMLSAFAPWLAILGRGISAAYFLALVLLCVVSLLRDRKGLPPLFVDEARAENRAANAMEKQHPGKACFGLTNYKNSIGGTPQ